MSHPLKLVSFLCLMTCTVQLLCCIYINQLALSHLYAFACMLCLHVNALCVLGAIRKPVGSGSTHKLAPVDPQRAHLKSRSSQRTGFSLETVSEPKDPLGKRQRQKSASGLTQSSWGEARQHRVLLEVPQRGDYPLNHSPRLSPKPDLPPNTDTARSRQDSSSLPPISKQLQSPPPHNSTRSPPNDSPTGRLNRHQRDAEEGSQPPLSTSPPSSPDKHRSNQPRRSYGSKAYPDRHQSSPRRTDSPDGAYSGNTYDDRGQR